MALYTCMLLFYLILAVINPIPKDIASSKKNQIYFALLLPIFIVIALRADTVGADTFSYSYLYERNGQKNFSEIFEFGNWLEPGYVVINYVFYHLGVSYYGFQIIVSIFFFISFYIFLSKYSTNIGLSCFFIASGKMFSMMNQTRMWIATCILLFAIDSIINKKLIKFFLFTFLASLFHKSVICAFLLYFLYNKRNKTLVRIAYLALCGMICFLGNSFFSTFTNIIGFYGSYTVIQDNFKIASVVGLINYCFYYLAFIVANRQSKELYKYHELSIDLIICLIGLSMISLRSVVMGRIMGYFSVYLCGFIPLEIDKIKCVEDKRLIMYIILVTATFMFFSIMIYRPNWDRVIPYKTMF